MPPWVLTSMSEPATLLEYSRVDFTLVVIQLSAISPLTSLAVLLALSTAVGLPLSTTS
ncbi:hypothetical protein D3C86_1854100 [compost metagenome]